MVKKYSFTVLVALSIFVATRLIMGMTGEGPSEMTLSLTATVLQNDKFQVFYLSEGDSGFNEKHSIISEVNGSDKPQVIDFVLPLDTTISKLRIDIGNNRGQSPLHIQEARLKTPDHSFSYPISESFLKNVHISEKDGKFFTKIVSNSYDPFFISNFNLTPTIKKLAEAQPLVDKTVAIIFALVFAVAAFISNYLKVSRSKSPSPSFYIATFIVIIATPPIVQLLGAGQKAESKEKRELSPMPEWTFNQSFPKEYEAYYNDNFGLRPTIINWASKLKIGVFRDSPQPELVQFGKQGFLFFNEHNAIDGGIYSSYSHTNLASLKQLENGFSKQFKLKQQLAARGMDYVVGFWPNKHTIYNELLPFTMKVQIQGETSLADQAVEYFDEKGMSLFDVRKHLLKEKQEDQLYFKFDSHWNLNGAYGAYRAFCEQTYDELGLSPFPKEAFEVSYIKIREGDLTNLLGIDGMDYYDEKPNYRLKDGNKAYRFVAPTGIYQNATVTLNENCGNDKTALVFRDSYGAALIQFLSLHYSKVVYVGKSPVDMYWVDQVDPDVVILGVVERRLPYILDTVNEVGKHAP
ncbi:hypothetical protein RQM65_09690 [Pricia sp. S334]|uniref:AlgX/AlgJ SGNH hydrolase-like domain-containing protein n=1 Tax=Pricia mediterranea TaxID=3076079 RepID=A0ABU3L658_9FLAO|nr:hypothetical protein [Pricia sp. S334]MDT7828932.1 hypothetical protein [Pricia sp. S334]